MRTLVLIPTYNERANLAGIVGRLRAAVPAADVLVLDDNSPDGTGALADELAAADGQVHVVHRTAKQGLGPAYLAGFDWGLERGYDLLVEMDADGSHQPEQLPALLAVMEREPAVGLVIGSRWVSGGSVVNWPRYRKALSVGANYYTRLLLGMQVHDATAGYRVYRASTLRAMSLREVASQGYCFQVDLTWRTSKDGHQIVEVPIEFVEREVGDSKMSPAIVRESLYRILSWGAKHRLGQARSAVASARRGTMTERWHSL